MHIFVDEVGCASIAGPVLTCAVAVDLNKPKISGVNDSKKLSKKQRNNLYGILQNELIYEFGTASPNRIEKINIHYAKYYAMKIAVERISKRVNIKEVIIDGNFIIPNLSFPQKAVIKADEKFWQCGAASILAKVKRDNIMERLSQTEKYSHYDWENNAGYFVENTHKWGIVEFGGTELHRWNFGYYQYCLFCRKKYEEFLSEGKTLDDYKNFEIEESLKHGKSFYSVWKSGIYNE